MSILTGDLLQTAQEHTHRLRLSGKLEEVGATVINKKADDTVCLDRRLITGASPQAANQLGELAAKTLLDHAKGSGR